MSDRPMVEVKSSDSLARYHISDESARMLAFAETGMGAFENLFFPDEYDDGLHPKRLPGGGVGVGEMLGGERDAELDPELLKLRKEFLFSVFGMNANDFKDAIDEEQQLLGHNLASLSKKKATGQPDFVSIRSILLDYARRTAIPKNFALWTDDPDDIKAFDMTGIPITVLKNMKENKWIKWLDMEDIEKFRRTSDPKDKPQYKEGTVDELIQDLTEQIPALHDSIQFYASASPKHLDISTPKLHTREPIPITLRPDTLTDTDLKRRKRRQDTLTWFRNAWEDGTDNPKTIAILRREGDVEAIGIQTKRFGQVVLPLEDFVSAASLRMEHHDGVTMYCLGESCFSINGTGESKAILAEDFFRRLKINGHVFPAKGRVVTWNEIE